jgi:hypothetical protein
LMYRTMYQFNRHHLIMPFNYRYATVCCYYIFSLTQNGQYIQI